MKKTLLRVFLVIAFLLTLQFEISAKNNILSGIIKTEKDELLTDVCIPYKRTNSETGTDFNGAFKINFEKDKNVIVVLYIGFLSKEIEVDQNSNYTDALKTLPQLFVVMDLAEVKFIKAKLALNVYKTGKTTKQHYEAGIAASIIQWGTVVTKDFFIKKTVEFDATATPEKQMEVIMMQKYYASFFIDYQEWFKKRRTGLPVLPRGLGIPEINKFPSGVLCATYFQSLNPDGLAEAVASKEPIIVMLKFAGKSDKSLIVNLNAGELLLTCQC